MTDTKLKTLADLEEDCCGAGEYCKYDNYMREGEPDKAVSAHSCELREAAREWVEELEKFGEASDDYDVMKHETLTPTSPLLDVMTYNEDTDDWEFDGEKFIKHFFNLGDGR